MHHALRQLPLNGGRARCWGLSIAGQNLNKEYRLMIRRFAVLVGLAGTLGCYHATVETGLTPSTITVEKAWASSWIYGLVPPSAVSTAAKCSTGIAKVETQLPFVNMLVGFLTGGIYTPMSIKVTCATRGSASLDTPSAPVVRVTGNTEQAWTAAYAEAVRLSSKMKIAVFVEEPTKQP